MIEQSSAEAEAPGGLAKTGSTRRVVVSPDDVFQADSRDVRLVSLESVVFRFMGVTAAIMGVVVLAGLLWLVLAH